MIETVGSKFIVEEVRKQFPILKREINGNPLVYFDNGATSQKPQSVIDALSNFYSNYNSNIHRGVHTLSQEATQAYEDVRTRFQQFLNAKNSNEIIFTSGTTGGINLIANSFGKHFLNKGDEVIISEMEHHSNIVPWQMICDQLGAMLKVVPVLDNGELDMEAFKSLLNSKTTIVSIVHISNSLGTINPIKEIIDLSHSIGAKVHIDGAQAVQHMRIDVQDLDCDFYTFSIHKMFGPTGVGIMYGKEDVLDDMPPYQGGGDMIKTVSFEKTTYNELPHKFEAGTPNIADGIACMKALDFIESLDWEEVHLHETELLNYATQELKNIEGLRIIGEAKEKTSLNSFVFEGIHAYDIGVLIDKMGVAVRTGHHCTQPLMKRFGVEGTVRASFALYNTKEEVDRLIEAILRAKKMLA